MKKNTANNKLQPSQTKPGLLQRILNKVDTVMKEKADAQAKNSNCCSSDNNKGNKCC
jgi:hypothetical protein